MALHFSLFWRPVVFVYSLLLISIECISVFPIYCVKLLFEYIIVVVRDFSVVVLGVYLLCLVYVLYTILL